MILNLNTAVKADYQAVSPLLDTALEMYDAGYTPIPLQEYKKEPIAKAKWRQWRDERPSRQTIIGLFTGHMGNIALMTGYAHAPGGLIVVDVDDTTLGKAYLRNYPTGMVALTPSGGTHLYFRYPAGVTTIKTTRNKIAPGVDTQADSGIVVVAPSEIIYDRDKPHRGIRKGDRGVYKFVATNEPAILPDELYQLITYDAANSDDPYIQAANDKRQRNQPLIDALTSDYTNKVWNSDSDFVLYRRIQDALKVIPVQQSYDDWLRVLMAVHDAFPDQRGIELIEAWSPGKPGEVAYKFASFDRGDRERSVTVDTLWYMASRHGWADSYIPPQPLRADRIVSQRFITPDMLTEFNKPALIRSDVGTGKTTAAIQLIHRLQTMLGREPRVLVVLHRRSLADDYVTQFRQKGGFELAHYLKVDPKEWSKPNMLVVVVNSLWKFRLAGGIPDYDLLIIDEIEELLPQFEAIQDADNRRLSHQALKTLIASKAQLTVVPDAYLSETGVGFIQNLRDDAVVYRNDHHEIKGDLHLFGSDGEALAWVTERIEENQGAVLIATDWKNTAKALKQWFAGIVGASNILLIDGDHEDADSETIARLNEVVKEKRVIIYNNTLQSGVDITTPVYAVVGIFHNFPLTAPSMLQMLGRARNAAHRGVYVPEKQQNYELTNASDIYAMHLTRVQETAAYADFDLSGSVVFPKEVELLALLSQTKARDNRSRNHLFNDFYHLAKVNYNLIISEDLRNGVKRHAEYAKDLKRIAKENGEQFKAMLIQVEPISRDEYEYKRLLGTNTLEDYAAWQKWEIINVFKIPSDVEFDLSFYTFYTDDGVRKLYRYMDYHDDEQAVTRRDYEYDLGGSDPNKMQAITRMKHRTAMRNRIRDFAQSVWGDTGIQYDDWFTPEQLEAARKWWNRNKLRMNKFGVKIRTKQGEKVSGLIVIRTMLDLIGLTVEATKLREGEGTINAYRIDPASVAFMDMFSGWVISNDEMIRRLVESLNL